MAQIRKMLSCASQFGQQFRAYMLAAGSRREEVLAGGGMLALKVL